MHISAKCSVAVHCLIFIYEYGEKEKVTSELLSRSTGINPVTIRNILSSLKKDGIIDVKSGTGGATLKCAPSEITLYRVWKAIEPDFLAKLIGVHSTPSELCPVGRNIHNILDDKLIRVQEAMERELKAITLADVMDDLEKNLRGGKQ